MLPGDARGAPATGAGFIIPYADAPNVRPITYLEAEPRLAAAEGRFLEHLERAAVHAPALAAMQGPPPEPRLDQDWFPRLDAAMAYALVRELRPRRIVEVGSGHSTRFMARALRDGAVSADLLCIDPAPRATLAGLPLQHHRARLQDAGPTPFANLAAGDMLFVDSSHVAMPGTDVDLLLTTILPRMPAGLLLHLHDVFLPDPYPESWAWRGYNEQGQVAALLGADRFEPIFASHWVTTRQGAAFARSPLSALPKVAGAFETSFWCRLR